MPDKKEYSRPADRGMGGGKSMGFARPKNFGGTLMRIFGYFRDSKGLIVLVIFALIISSLTSIAGGYFLRPLINDYIIPGDVPGLAKALLQLGGIYLVGLIASYAMTRTNVQLANKTITRIRSDMFDRMQSLPLKFFDTHTHGELMSRYTNDADNIYAMLEQSLTQLISSVIVLVGAVTLMILLSPILFGITALIIAFMFLAAMIMGKKSRKYFTSQQEILGRLNGQIEESIGGLKEIKAFNHEGIVTGEFDRINIEFRDAAQNANFFAGIMMPVMFNLNNLSYALCAVVGGVLTVFGLFDLGSLASYLQFSRQIGQPINQIAGQMNNLYAAVAGAERIFAMMDELPEIDDGKVTLTQVQAGDGDPEWDWILEDGSHVPLRGDVRFHDVTFSYDGEKTVLKEVSLYAKPGQMIAFVGSTGAGKTTITNLINRFYDVQQGSITYDGIDVKRISKDALRSSLGMVLQDTHLFNCSVLDNIRYGKLDATDEQCMEAAKKAGAHSFIKRLTNGYHTLLERDGSNLSQGQRQLLAIARTYISDPPVMILDEATSSIDTRTERQLQKAMDTLMKNRTVFVIAHRLSTVQGAKAIIVLENGAIIERGNHDELLLEKGRYYQLHNGLLELA